MATASPRVSVACKKETLMHLNALAKKYDTSVSIVAHDLISQALERNEDLYFSRLAEKRYQKNTKTISHKDAWK